MTKHYTYTAKQNGDTLNASEWNALAQDVSAAVDAINSGTINSGSSNNDNNIVSVANETVTGGDPKVGMSIQSGVTEVGSPKVIELTKKKKGVNTTLVADNNINIEPRESVGTTKGGNISFKPGDDIELCSHHRTSDNQGEVSVKVIDGDDNPVQLQLNASELVLTTKDKLGDNANVMDITVNSAKKTRGYLKVRAQAIDLRCEEHGGIALQPKGTDSDGHMNKIKFEHGGGDGLEFGTFNAEKTSIYTDEYRFKKNGKWIMTTRTKSQSNKADASDATTAYKYDKQADDFYDVINDNDATATTEEIINVANAFAIVNSNALVAGKSVPSKYDIKKITVDDFEDDSDFVNSHWDGPRKTGYNIGYYLAGIYELLDTLELADAENFVDAINGGSTIIVAINADNVYRIRKAGMDVTVQDIYTLVDYMKTNHQGPWANA